jgi:hypothetical protein
MLAVFVFYLMCLFTIFKLGCTVYDVSIRYLYLSVRHFFEATYANKNDMNLLLLLNCPQYYLCSGVQYTLGGVDFCIFWIFDLLQRNLDWQKNSKTKVEKAFFFIFMSSDLVVPYCNSMGLF